MTTTAPSKNASRLRRHARVRGRVSGTSARPRLAVFKSNRYVSAQLIDDVAGTTLAASSGRALGGSQGAQAVAVGKDLAQKAKAAGITAVVFDRGGYQFTGLIKALAEAAREGGLIF